MGGTCCCAVPEDLVEQDYDSPNSTRAVASPPKSPVEHPMDPDDPEWFKHYHFTTDFDLE